MERKNKSKDIKIDWFIVITAVIIISVVIIARVILNKKDRLANKIINTIKVSATVDEIESKLSSMGYVYEIDKENNILNIKIMGFENRININTYIGRTKENQDTKNNGESMYIREEK